MIKLVVATTIAATCVLTACSSNSTPAAQVAKQGSSSTVAPAESTAWSTSQAREEYLTDIQQGNELISQLNRLGSAPKLAALSALCGEIADSDDIVARKLMAGRWPNVAQNDVTKLVAALTVERVSFQSCHTASSTSGAYQALNSAGIDTAGAAAEQVRLDLGLPGNS